MDVSRYGLRRSRAAAVIVLAAALSTSPRSEIVGVDAAAGFSLCESAFDSDGEPRDECQAADLRLESEPGVATRFGFAVAAGYLNGDDFEDLVVGDPERNRVYVFFGRASASTAYGLDPESLADRGVTADTQADVILWRDPAAPGQVGSFGFSLAVGRERDATGCSDGAAAPLLIGAPGQPGTTLNAPGRAFYLPPGSLCLAVSNPPSAQMIDPATIGGSFFAVEPAQDDEFGYSVAFGRVMTTSDTHEDAIVGARGAVDGAGRVSAFSVTGGSVNTTAGEVVRIVGLEGDGLGENVATGDLDADFDPLDEPNGAVDDLAIGAVGQASGKVLIVDGPLSPTGGSGMTGVFQEGLNARVHAVLGEKSGDFFGFGVAVSSDGQLAVGAVYADNEPPDLGGNPASNVSTGTRINGGKLYFWDPGILTEIGLEATADTADVVLVARRSGDHLGFGVAFADVDGSGAQDLIVSARREDGSGLTVDEIDQGTAYVVLDGQFLGSPLDLSLCAGNSDCTGVSDVNVLIFGGDRDDNLGDEIGFAVAAGNLNGDTTDDIILTSLTHHRAYVVTLEDTDDDRATQGRNIRDDDDDDDGDSDATDCGPLDPDISSAGFEIACNGFDENCNGLDDDAPDADDDGFDACGSETVDADCDDGDALSFPGATELCDGNDNACAGAVPADERDLDVDGWVGCTGWSDIQGDDAGVIGGGDCDDFSFETFPGAAPNEADPAICARDFDGDGWGDLDPPAGVAAGTDCDDSSPGAEETFPGAAPNEATPGLCRRDADGDDWGDLIAPAGVQPGTDCDDTDAASFPGAAEVCDGNDNACAGSVPPNELDMDGDSYVICSGWLDTQANDPAIAGGGDCDGADLNTFPGASPNEASPDACTKDADGDDWGDLQPPVGVTAGTDCDDDSPAASATFPGAADIEAPLNCMKDLDDDGYGDDSATLPVVAGTDCDDDDATRSSGASEIPGDGIDQDCDGVDSVTCFTDGDGDGFGGTDSFVADDGDCDDDGESDVDTDCDDVDPAINPGSAEIADDGIDQDCNGTDTVTCFVDADGDGRGTLAGTEVLADDGSCDTAQQESTFADDCDDDDDASFPGAPEACDGNDNACAGAVPSNEVDGEGDGFVPCSGWNDTQGDDPSIAGGDDCDDGDNDTFPGSAENESFSSACMRDEDGDGYGDAAPPAGVTAGSDCDDEGPGAADTFPGAAPADAPLNCMKDSDGDDRGDGGVALPVVAGSDCDDDDPTTYGGAPELCDGIDNSCSGALDADEIDVDGDGFAVCAGDCDETAGDTFPGSAPNEPFATACMQDADDDDWGDQLPAAGVTPGTDCDDSSGVTFPGAAPLDAPLNCLKDADGDDYGDSNVVLPVVPGTDCDDDLIAVNPGTPEGPMGDPTCSDMLDNDCDGTADALDPVCQGTALPCPDADTDGFADCTTDPNCDPQGLTCGDCDDAAPAVNPDGIESCDSIDNDCNGTVDDGFDTDDDGFTVCALPVADCDDTDSEINPDADEVCADGKDNDCDGATPDVFDGDSDGTTCDLDCNDADPALNRNDVDGDTVDTCDGDCDDADDAINPLLAEVCADGKDNDCDAGTVDLFDGDSDGSTCDLDCDDADPDVKPGASEVCDNVDNNCDGSIDEGFDGDTDGYTTCDLPLPDCDDGDGDVNPGASELCGDGLDNDCNPATPDAGDGDGDGATCEVDCDDADPNSFPGAAELCDGNDNNCDGSVPPDETDADGDAFVACGGWNDTQGDDPTTLGGGDCDAMDADTYPGSAPNEVFSTACMRDVDGDDYGELNPPPGITAGTDCDDAGPFGASTFPGAAAIDAPLNCAKDSDGDDYGDAAASLPVVAGTDCDDGNAATNPGGTEVCDNADNNCDGSVDEGFDADSDGFTVCDLPSPDCDDGDPDRNPGEAEVCGDGQDNDCDGGTPDLFDGDADGAACDVDCDDGDPASFPGAVEACDGNDNACAGAVPPGETDGDLDGFVECAGWNDTQGDDAGIAGGGDCNGSDASTFPGAAPNEALFAACMQDADGDDYGELTPPPGVTPGSDCDDTGPDAASTFPGAAINDGVLNCLRDVDGDDWGDATALPPVGAGTDCDDGDPASNPAETEGPAGDPTCSDGADNDCDTQIDLADPQCAGPAARAPGGKTQGQKADGVSPNRKRITAEQK